jgi:hypothetical protein
MRIPGQSQNQPGRACEESKGIQLHLALKTRYWEPLVAAVERLHGFFTRPFQNSEVQADPTSWTGVACIAAFKMATELGEAGLAAILAKQLLVYLAAPDTPEEHKQLLQGARFVHRWAFPALLGSVNAGLNTCLPPSAVHSRPGLLMCLATCLSTTCLSTAGSLVRVLM